MKNRHHKVPLFNTKEPILSQARLIKKLHPQKKIEITVHLRKKPQCPDFFSLDYYTETPLFKQKHFTHDEFEEIFGASIADIEKVKAFAKKNGLIVKDIRSTHREICLIGSIKEINQAFEVHLNEYCHKKKGEHFRGHEGLIHIPEELKDIVVNVSGLSTPPIISRPHILGKNLNLAWKKLTNPDYQCPYFIPPQLAKLYNFPKDANGKGQSIGIIELGGGYDLDSLQEYFDGLDIPMPNITWVGVDGGKNNPGVNLAYDGEVCLDIEVAASIAPGADIVVYFASGADHQSFFRAIQYAVHDKDHNNTIR